MFRQPNIPNLRFTIIQAVNPYIQSSSNKFIGKAVSFLPNKMFCIREFDIKYPKFDILIGS